MEINALGITATQKEQQEGGEVMLSAFYQCYFDLEVNFDAT